jgi:suppressor of ftsI
VPDTARAADPQALPPKAVPLPQPQEIRSVGGILNATLSASEARVDLGAGVSFPGYLYNGSYMPPLLRVRIGDVMRLRFNNELRADPSNLHFHGLSVSPRKNSDNVFIHVHPGEHFDYEVLIPQHGRQEPGLYWYHPHAHGVVAKQILGGLSGGLLVDGFERYFPLLRDVPEKVLLIKQAELNEREIISINGIVNPVLTLAPKETQFWRIGNIGATLFVRFRIDGMPFYVLGTDGHPLSSPRQVEELFLGPGERVEALVVGPPAGEYAMQTMSFQNEAWKSPDPAQHIATVISAGAAVAAKASESQILQQRVKAPRWIDEIRASRVSKHRTLKYSRSMDRSMFMIDGRVMDENRIDQRVKLGSTERWTVVNTDQQYHSFHIHQTAFMVTAINGVAQSSDSLHDTYSLPPATALGPSSLTVVIPFTDPVIVGTFVYHCHAVDHEDKGMMGVIQVIE